MLRKLGLGLLASSLVITATGCIIIDGHGWCLFGCGSNVWTDEVTEKIPFDAADLKALDVQTHNGSITVEGQAEGSNEAFVVVSKKARGWTGGSAKKALQAIEVFVERTGDGTQRFGWKWKGLKQPSWSARVSFDIKAPGRLALDATTHNGPVDVKGLTGNVRLVTHNGAVDVESAGGDLYAETHNGRIMAAYSGAKVELTTHNGRVVADLARCGPLAGSVTTHNGSVEVTLGENASTRLTARTHNGSIKCDVPFQASEVSRHKVTGTLGGGESQFAVTTHNGGIRLRKAAG